MDLYLGIPSNSGIDWTRFSYQLVHDFLVTWLNSGCPGGGPVRVIKIVQPEPAMKREDALVYLIGDPTNSIAARVGAPGSTDLPAGHTAGWRGQLISEVYVNGRQSPYSTAATIYHEVLHNKFNLALDIHNFAGNFNSAVAAFSMGGPNQVDQDLMCRAIKEVPLAGQYQGGF
jgi:hypothetical protein